MKKIIKMFNDDLVIGTFISNLFVALSVPATTKVIYSSISARYISANMFFVCLTSIVLGLLWVKYEKKLYKNFALMIVLQNVLYIGLVIALLSGFATIMVYFITNTILYTLFTRNIVFGSNKLKANRYLCEQRKTFDNNMIIASNMASLIGYSIGWLLLIPTNVAFILGALAILSDGYYNIKVYRNRNKVR